MGNEILQVLATHLIEIVFSILGIVLTAIIIPWLKEKKLVNTVKILVEAAEKLAQTQDIDKLTYVCDLLESMGIKVTDEIRAKIEYCVLELDLKIKNTLTDIEENSKQLLNE